MTLTLLDLYNAAASQEWSMYDGEAATTEEMEKSLIIALNKALAEIMYSRPFHFRERTQVIITVPKIKNYELPYGLILKDKNGNFAIKANSKPLELITNPFELEETEGLPSGFYLKGGDLILYPTPAEKSIITIDYLTLALGENSQDDELYHLSNAEDTVLVPTHLEELLKQAVISKTMLNTISSESDENYSAYKKQFETAYKLLIKYERGAGQDKSVKI